MWGEISTFNVCMKILTRYCFYFKTHSFWLAWKICVFVMIIVNLDTINAMNVRLCMTAVLIKLCPLIPLLETLIAFKGTQLYAFIRLSWNITRLLITSSRSWRFFIFAHVHGILSCFLVWKKKKKEKKNRSRCLFLGHC